MEIRNKNNVTLAYIDVYTLIFLRVNFLIESIV